jgi:RNA polymerase sigma factor (sigma-70 family)
MRLATSKIHDQDDSQDQDDRKSISRIGHSLGRRSNHWATRNPDDFVRYPRLEPLSYLIESKLIERAKAGDIEARNDVWMHYARLTLSVVNHFRIPDHLLPDAIQEGCIGLTRAIQKFEIERFNSFSTYAWRWIYQYVQRFLVDNVLPLRLPSYLFPEYMRFRRELRECKAPGDENALMARWHRKNPRLYARIIRVHSVIHMVPSHLLERRQHPCSHDEEFVEHPNWDSVCREALQTLHERERSILQKRYGLYGGKPMNLREIGDEMHLTRERIRQIQDKAEKKLRRRCDRIRMLVEPTATDVAANEITKE